MSTTSRRKDLDGLRFRMPGQNAVYLIDNGRKRHIPNPAVYNELFEDWKHIHLDIDIDEIETGDPLPETAMLFRCFDSPKVFFLDGEPPKQIKRHVASPAVMERYHFNWSKVHLWNAPLNAIGFDDGEQLQKTGRVD